MHLILPSVIIFWCFNLAISIGKLINWKACDIRSYHVVVMCSFWVILRRLSSNSRRFGTHCRFHLHRQVNEVCQWRECVG